VRLFFTACQRRTAPLIGIGEGAGARIIEGHLPKAVAGRLNDAVVRSRNDGIIRRAGIAPVEVQEAGWAK